MTSTDEDNYVWYGLDGKPANKAVAVQLLRDFESRKIGSDALDFYGDIVIVVTSFVPINMNPVPNNDPPWLWISEIVGGPPDMNGRNEYYTSQTDAKEGHRRMIEQALASGCTMIQS